MISPRLLLPVCCLLAAIGSRAQQIKQLYQAGDLGPDQVAALKAEFGSNKTWPDRFEKSILLALSHYPELKLTPIRFVTRPNHAPGFTRVTWGGLFSRPANRHFLVVISDSTEEMLRPLLFKNLPFNAQVAAIGHELAHVADFLNKSTLEIFQHAFNNVSRRYIDRFEFNTDAIAIDHGLGYQMLDWSRYVRSQMHTENWDGPAYVHKRKRRERYMNPATIRQKMLLSPLYQPAAGQ